MFGSEERAGRQETEPRHDRGRLGRLVLCLKQLSPDVWEEGWGSRPDAHEPRWPSAPIPLPPWTDTPQGTMRRHPSPCREHLDSSP